MINAGGNTTISATECHMIQAFPRVSFPHSTREAQLTEGVEPHLVLEMSETRISPRYICFISFLIFNDPNFRFMTVSSRFR